MEKKTGKKLIIGGIALLAAGGLLFAGWKVLGSKFLAPKVDTTETTDGSEVKTLHLSLSTDAMEGSVLYQIAQNFADRVADMSDGKLEVDLYEYGQLGKNSDMITFLDSETQAADLLFVSADALRDAGCTKVEDTMKACAFKNHADFAKWVTSSKADQVLADTEKSGIGGTGLFFVEDGFYQTFLMTADPIAEKTILGLGFDESDAYYKKKNAHYEFGPYVDIPDRVANGTIAGAELPFDQFEEEKMYEYLPYVVNDNHMVRPYEAIITLRTADKIGEDSVALLKKAGQETVKEYADILTHTDEETLARLKKAGVAETALK